MCRSVKLEWKSPRSGDGQRMGRQRDAKRRALAFTRAVGRDRAAMQLDELFGDVQTESAPLLGDRVAEEPHCLGLVADVVRDPVGVHDLELAGHHDGSDEFARGLLAAMRSGETVGILMDTNMTPPQGVFVSFFGVPACTASGLARVALKTGAAVVPGFTLWDPQLRKYRIQFSPALELIRTGDNEADVVANTELFTRVIEQYARRYPEQWLWVHRRWKTRPEGMSPIY